MKPETSILNAHLILDRFSIILKHQNSFDKFTFARIDIQQCSSVRMSLCVWVQLNCVCASPRVLSEGPCARCGVRAGETNTLASQNNCELGRSKPLAQAEL